MGSSGLVQSGRVAKRSFLVQMLVGITEVIFGLFTLSAALIADGIQSFADAGVSLIVWLGLRISRRAPDGKFHFGYHRFETFSSIVAALFVATLGIIVLYTSYIEFLNPTIVFNAELALIVAFAAAMISSGLLVYKTRAAKKYGSLALKTDASNSIKDVLTSVTAFVGIFLSKYFNILQTDAVAGIIISLFVFTMVYSIIKEASLVLLDACQCTDILADIEKIALSTKHVKGVHGIRMRKAGSYLIGDLHVTLDADMTVREASEIASEIERKIMQEFDEVMELKVRIEPHEDHE